MARWSAKALLITTGVFLVGGGIWYARAATVPLIVAALISTQVLPLVVWADGRGVKRGLAIAGCLVGVVLISAALAWIFTDALIGNLGGVVDDISAGVEKVIARLRDNDDWVAQHEAQIRHFLKGILPAANDAASRVLSGVLNTLTLAAQLISGALLTFVFLLYILTSGSAIWHWVRDRFSPDRRDRVGVVGVAAWNAASGYIRGIALVAFIDTTVITLGNARDRHAARRHARATGLHLAVHPDPRRVGVGHRDRARHARRARHGSRRRNGRRHPDRPAALQHVRHAARLPTDRQPASGATPRSVLGSITTRASGNRSRICSSRGTRTLRPRNGNDPSSPAKWNPASAPSTSAIVSFHRGDRSDGRADGHGMPRPRRRA
jgi:hypothetical protein